MNRRDYVAAMAAAVFSRGLRAQSQTQAKSPITLPEFEPRSMLAVPETKPSRARFPLIDIHTHLRNNATTAEILAVMDRKNIRIMVNLTGGFGPALEESIRYWHKPHPHRFLVFTQPWFSRLNEQGYPQFQADELGRARKAGARGLKVLKYLGLVLRERIKEGPLVRVDDPRFDPMWEAAGALKMPVAIHTSDPRAFFLPIDRFNERYEELNAHPDWSFHGRDYPSNKELQEARIRVIARHPKTQFICLHVADSEDLAWVAESLARYPNMHVEIGARIGELGRQPRAARTFFDKFQDRILFGTDAVPRGFETPQQIFGEQLYEIYYRFLETEDEYFDYAPAKVPPQGRWRIYGLGLPEGILKKVYWDNASRLLGL
jgi:hypothetical protein